MKQVNETVTNLVIATDPLSLGPHVLLQCIALVFRSCSTFAVVSVLPQLCGAVPVSLGLYCSLRSDSGDCAGAPGFPVCAGPSAPPKQSSSPAQTGSGPG